MVLGMDTGGGKSAGGGPGQCGLTLIEVLIAVVILAFAASILIFSSRSSVTGQLRSKVYGDAATATKEALQGVELLPLDSLSRLRDTPMAHSQGPGITVLATARSLLPGDVEDLSRLDTSTLRHVTLRTLFKKKSGENVAKQFTTILFRP